MLLFSSVCDGNNDFLLMLNSPIIKHDKKREILQSIFKGKVNALTLSIFDVITRKNREPLLPGIAKEFHNAYNTYKNISKATVITTTKLEPALKAEFEKMAKTLTSRESIELIEKIDKEMIGGFVLNVGDKQIDASIKNKLKALRVRFSQNPFIKDF
jgi:F-type H+-transporting ATPase subunit delta